MDAAAAAGASSSSSSSCNGGNDPDDSIFSSDGALSSFSSSPHSSSSSSSELDHKGPLFEMSPLMTQLPVKRGLSMFYQGKSQSFTCLGDARCVEDLAKEETTPHGKRRKTTRKSCYNLDAIVTQMPCFVPGSKSERNKSSSLPARRGRSGGGSLFSKQ